MTTQQTANPQAENVPPQGLAPSLAKDQHGNTLVEMAIVLPCFFLLLFGLFQFAQICYGYNAANYAVREATRYASLHSLNSVSPATFTSIENLVVPYMAGNGAKLSPANCPTSCFSVTYSGTQTPGNTVTVAAGLQYCINLPYWKGNGNCIILIATDTRTIIR